MDYGTIDAIGHVGFAFLLLGKWAVAHRHRWGWLSWMVGASIWLVLGVFLGLSSMMLWQSIYLVMYSYGWWKWGQDGSS